MRMRKCIKCSAYTMKETCPKCGSPASHPIPPSFSPEDKYGKYRRIAKLRNEQAEKEDGAQKAVA